MTTPHQGAGGMDGNTEVLVQLAEIRGQLNTFIGFAGRLDTNQSKLETHLDVTDAKVAAVDSRVTVLETTRRATPTFWTVVAGVAGIGSIIVVVLVFLDRLYGK